MVTRPQALILTGYGINCDIETEHAFAQAGADTRRVHLNDLIAGQVSLEDFQILVVPGGFSFGDDLGSGKVMAVKIARHLQSDLERHIAAGRLVIGICNGFQVLVQLGLLPAVAGSFKVEAALSANDNGRFEDRWVHLAADPSSPCVFTRDIERLELPIRHGEGKFMASPEVLAQLESSHQIALRYVDPTGRSGEYPWNPNGSLSDVAGICDPTGRVFGLMPHPEAAAHPTNHPRWTRGEDATPAATQVFTNAVAYVRDSELTAA